MPLASGLLSGPARQHMWRHMRRRAPALALTLLLAGPAAADPGLWQKLSAQPDLFARELRAMLLEQPEVIEAARAEARRRMAEDAASDLAAEIDGDQALIARHGESLFGVTPQGFGGDGPAAITLFTAAGCTDCLAAETGLRALADSHPGLRVEVRSLSDALPDRLSRALARQEGPEAAARFRAALAKAPSDPEALATSLSDAPEALLALADSAEIRAALAQEKALFGALGLDMAPSYVMPDRLIRGSMPKIVLERYLNN
ncbi:hypothetical protein [Oceanicola sp. S124]|uniref:hypothetical protein n=1 Tax=Oceanicola sp. S124 TaxID=1042378 RepID=UPI00049417BE|nr:hypothetical protein [Oceanicola sp. S124]